MNADIRTLGRSGRTFLNWARTYSCNPELFFEPESTAEIQQILKCARERGKKVKIWGNGHSPSDIACTTDYMISLRKYNKVLEVNKEKHQVTVQGGSLVRDLNNTILPQNGLAMSVLGAISDISIAGLISTGTHGTGANYGIISSMIVSLQLMTAAGDILEISKDSNAELLPAVCVSLGCLGVILSVTLQCEPTFKLHCKQYPCKLDDVLENLNVYATASEHFRFFWYPYTDGVVCFHSNRTTEDTCNEKHWLKDKLIGYYVLQFLYWLGTLFSFMVPFINRLYYRFIFSTVVDRVDRSDKMFNYECLFHQYVMEWAIPRDKTPLVLKELQSWIENSRFPSHFPVEVRFVKADNFYLSPAFGRETCYINIIAYRPYNRHIEKAEYWDAFQKIASSVGGRPHWAKDHNYGKEQFEVLYPEWETFCKIRESLDPNRMFMNANLERVFGK